MDLQLGSRAFLRCLLLYAFLTRDSLAQDPTGPPDRPIPPLPERPTEGCPGPTEQGGLVCYLSTDCRGGIFLRETDDGGFAALTSAAECCSGAGLSFCDERGCDNCYNEEDYTSTGTEFYLGFFNNLRFESRLSEANLRVQVTSADTEPAAVRVTYDGGDEEENVVVEPGQTVIVSIDSDLKPTGIGDRDSAVVVRSINGQRITVAGLGEELTSADSFCVLPAVFLPTVYEYYAVSVPRNQIQFISDGVPEIITPEEKSAFLIVTTEDATTVSLTLTQSVSTDGADDLLQFGPMINRGETVSLTLDRGQTLYISDVDDLTGSRVVTDKPITFLSGHECGTIPQTDQYCDQMVEQIPPTATWGVQFFTAPFFIRTGGDAFIALAAEDDTTINVICNQFSGELLRTMQLSLASAGDTTTFNTASTEYCSFMSDKPILLAQFSLASQTDGNEDADPFMVLVSPRTQYTDSVTFRVFETVTTLDEMHFVNIFIPAEFDRNGVRLNDMALNSDVWQPVICDDEVTDPCAYAAQVPINFTMQTVEHVDPNARLAVIVYSLGFRTGQGFSPGMLQRPIALDEISLSDEEYFVLESAGILSVFLERRGRLTEPASVLLQSRTQFTENAAQVGEDYFNVSTVVSFAPEQSQATVTVLLAPDDVFPEPNKTFELFLSPSEGIYITPFAAATVTILNDDPDLPVVEVRFADLFPFVVEGQGVLPVSLVKSDDAVGPVRVRLFTQDDTALGEIDYRRLDVIITFVIEETEKTEQIVILDDPVLEDVEFFTISIEAINDLEAGAFPVVAIDNSVVISMEDNDVVVIGFSPVPCRTSEGVEGLNVQVGLLVGLLGRNVSIQFETIGRTARAGEDFAAVSRTLVFTPARRGGNLFNVFVGISDDSVLEETESFTIQLSLDERDIEDNGVQLVHPEAAVFIEDDDLTLITLTLTPRVPEGGVALATIAAQGGQLGSEVRVRLNTISGNATSGVDFVPLNNLEVILDSENPSVSVEILTIDNSMFEGNKQFSVVAELVTVGRVGIDPNIATTTIVEDDIAPQVQCYFSAEDCSERSNFFELNSVSDCCLLLQAESFSFSSDRSGLCHDCIVIGFNRSEFLLVERDESYDLRVDVITGFLPQSITLGLVAIPGTATPDDYIIPPTLTLLFNPEVPASTDVLVNLPREVDDTDLPFESFRIEIEDSFGTAPPNVFFRGTVITIIDYEPVIQFSSVEYVGQAEQGPVLVAFVISPPTIGQLQMTLRLVSGTAIIGEDVEELETTVFEFEPGITDAPLPALTTVIEDSVLEDERESFSVEIVSVSEGVIGEVSTATVIIPDDDTLSLRVRGISGGEGGVAMVEIVKQDVAEIPITVNFELTQSFQFQPATPSEDFALIAPSFIIPPDQPAVNVTIPLLEDDISETREDFGVLLIVTDDRVSSPDGPVVLSINDNDLATVVFTQIAYTVDVNDDIVLVGVALTSDTFLDPDLAIIIFISVTFEGDIGVGFGQVQLSNTVREAEISIPLRNLFRSGAVFDLTAVQVSDQDILQPQFVLTPPATTITLTGAAATVGFNQTEYAVQESDGLVVIGVSVLAGQTAGVVVNVFTESLTAVGDGVDFVDVVRTLTVSSINSGLIFVEITDDDILEENEVFLVRLVPADESGVNLEPSTTSVTIINDDSAIIGFTDSFGFDTTFYSVNEDDGAVTVSVRVVAGQLDRDVVVQLSTVNDSAFEFEDYTPVIQDLTFNAQNQAVNFTILITNDDIPEDFEFFFVGLDLVTDIGDVILSPDFAAVGIDDFDRPQPVMLRFESSMYSVREGDTARLVVLLSSDEDPTTVRIIADGGSAQFGIDYEDPGLGQSTSERGTDSVAVRVVTFEDELAENTESVIVRIVPDDEGFTTVDPEQGEAILLIRDNDDVVIGFSRSVYSAFEGSDPSVEVTVTVMDGTLGFDFSVLVRTDDSSQQATATPELDYAPTGQVIVFNSDVTQGSVGIGIVDDSEVEDFSEVFFVFLDFASEVDDVNVTFSPRVTTVAIIDTDVEQFQVGFGTQSVTIPEGESEPLLEIFVTDGFLLNPVTVELEYISGTAEVGSDIFDLVTSVTVEASTLGPRALVRINAIFDERYEEDEEFLTVRIASVSEGSIDPEFQEATVIIQDADILFIEVERFSIREGSQEQGNVTLIIGIASDVSIELRAVSVFNDTLILPDEGQQEIERQATPDVDYFPVNQSLFLEAGQSSLTTTLQLTPIDDPITEGPEFVIIDYIPVGRSRIEVFAEFPATIIIVDDDTTVIGFRSTVFDAFEGSFDPPEEGQVTVIVDILLGELADGVQYFVNFETVELVDQPDVATEGEDYIPVQRILRFSSAVTSEQISIQLPADGITGEFMEQFEVRISPAEESSSSPLLVALEPSVATVTIQDSTPQ